VIGILSALGFPGFFADVQMPAFSQGLKEAGFAEGKKIAIEVRLADSQYDRLPSLAAELVRREPESRAAADRLKQHLEVLTASTESELEAAFAAMVERHVGSLIVMPDPFFVYRREQLVALAARHAIPAIYPFREFADFGGLMSYGSHPRDLFQQAGIYVGKILKGAKPTDLPVQQSTQVQLVINLRTAKALGLKFPDLLLAQADEVIE
jgi:putative ABC transport system substrate-binding protein